MQENINFEYTDQEYKEVPYQILTNYSSDKHDYRPNWHNEIEFIYVVSGFVEVYIENDFYIAKPGDIVAINSNKIHTFQGNDWKFHCLKIASPILESLELQGEIVFSTAPLIYDEELGTAFSDIIEEYYKDHVFKLQFQTLAIQKFFMIFIEKYTKIYFEKIDDTENSHFTISVKVIKYLNQHLSEDFSINDIANEIGVSSSHMSRCFKGATGSNIVDYLNRQRCYNAKHYLMHSNKKISEIAKLCGFQNSAYFARIYKKYVKCTPYETQRNSVTK